MFYLLLPNLETRQLFIAHLRARGAYAVFHYLPLHRSEMGRRFSSAPSECPVSEEVSDRIVRLPFFTGLSDADQDRVVDAVLSWNC